MATEKKQTRPRSVPPMPQPREVTVAPTFAEHTTALMVYEGWHEAARQSPVKTPRGGGDNYREIRIRDLEFQALETLLASHKGLAGSTAPRPRHEG